MSAAVTVRLLMSVFLVMLLGPAASAQPAATKPAQKKAAGKSTAPAKARASVKAPAPAAPADVTIRTKYTSGAQMSENTTYVKGERLRVEFPGVVSIQQCDLGQALVINPGAKTYFVTRQGTPAGAGASAPAAATGSDPVRPESAKSPRGGLVTYTTTLNDTGERKQVFGREARHVTTTMTKTASESACNKTPLTVEVDAWYIDFPSIARCSAPAAPAVAAPVADACADQVESRTTGEAKLGLPIAMTTTTRTGEGDKQDVQASSMEVTALDVSTLDAALFAVPAGYTEVKSNAELAASFHGSSGLSDALVGSTADGTGTAAPKGADAVRVGVLEPVDKSARNLPTSDLRQQLAGDFHDAPYEALALPGSSVAEAQAEAARMECDYILYSEITGIKTSKPGKVGGMLKKVSGQAVAREVHEVKLDYRLYPVGAAAATPSVSESVKASSDRGSFGFRSALNMFIFAGSMYMRFTSLGLLGPSLLANVGGRGSLGGATLFDPRATAMSSISHVLGPDASAVLGDQAEAQAGADADGEIRRTVDAAVGNVARGAIEHLKKNRRK